MINRVSNAALCDAFLHHKMHQQVETSNLMTARNVLTLFFRFCVSIEKDLDEIRLDDARQFKRYLIAKALSKSTVRNYISVVRVFYNFLNRLQVVDCNYFLLISDSRLPAKNPFLFSISDLKKIFERLNSVNYVSLFDLAVFECLYGTGMTAAELSRLTLTDFNCESESLTLRNKTKPKRTVPLPASTCLALRYYIVYRNLRFPMKQSLFTNSRGNRATCRTIYDAVKRVMAFALIFNVGSMPLRNAYRFHLLKMGANVEEVAQLVGMRTGAVRRFHSNMSLESIKWMHSKSHPKG